MQIGLKACFLPNLSLEPAHSHPDTHLLLLESSHLNGDSGCSSSTSPDRVPEVGGECLPVSLL